MFDFHAQVSGTFRVTAHILNSPPRYKYGIIHVSVVSDPIYRAFVRETNLKRFSWKRVKDKIQRRKIEIKNEENMSPS